MNISWTEIRNSASRFSHKWAEASSEASDKQTFWNDFFEVFGLSRSRYAQFESSARKAKGSVGKIDLLWKGVLLVEHKSRGQDLDSAYEQGLSYFEGLTEAEVPRYVLVSDFARIRLYDLNAEDASNRQVEFPLSQLPNQIQRFRFFFPGSTSRVFKDQEPVNIKAAELLGKLHNYLEKQNYRGRDLEVFMVRVLYCLFAEDSGIFDRFFQFDDYIRDHTADDGSDLGTKLNELFSTLDKAEADRQHNLDPDLRAFPHVNGRLFKDRIDPPAFDRVGRDTLRQCADFNWSSISPAIFGSLFQSVMLPAERRAQGAHYTSEKNILKVITSLFLDELHAEFEKVKMSERQLKQFHIKLANLTFLDPACGSGNFLIMAFRELRRLELRILQQQDNAAGAVKAKSLLDSRVSLEQFYGIELDDFAARVAEVALHMVDHQMNVELGDAFENFKPRLPLTQSPHITQGNALRLDWATIVPAEKLSYILGNPPFVAKHLMTADQQKDIASVFKEHKGAGELDYVSAWFAKAAIYIKGTEIKVALVATNSISQGEQVAILWSFLFSQKVDIIFAHRTFKWSNEASGNASVYIVIIGFSQKETPNKSIFDYENVKSEPTLTVANNINPYLINFDNILIHGRRNPLVNIPKIVYGNKPADGGHLILSDSKYNEMITVNPELKKFIRPLVSAKEYFSGEKRWCFWLTKAEPSTIKNIPELIQVLEKVKEFRLSSKKEQTRELAEYPSLFAEIRQPENDYLLVPRHSSENRAYIPMSIFTHDYIVHDSCTCIPNANKYLFGVLQSTMHMAWMKVTCGRLKSDYRYSNDLVYNTFPWPQAPTAAQVAKVEQCAQAVLDARAAHPTATLADLYDPLAMPPDLRAAHTALDRAVDQCYRKEKFGTELERIQFLFELYRQYTAPLLPAEPPVKGKRGRKAKG